MAFIKALDAQACASTGSGATASAGVSQQQIMALDVEPLLSRSTDIGLENTGNCQKHARCITCSSEAI